MFRYVRGQLCFSCVSLFEANAICSCFALYHRPKVELPAMLQRVRPWPPKLTKQSCCEWPPALTWFQYQPEGEREHDESRMLHASATCSCEAGIRPPRRVVISAAVS